MPVHVIKSKDFISQKLLSYLLYELPKTENGKLPPASFFAEKFGVSIVTIREILKSMESKDIPTDPDSRSLKKLAEILEEAVGTDNMERSLSSGPRNCPQCFRPRDLCLCSRITPVNTGVKFVILMHPREAKKQRTGTGRMTSLSLSDSEIIIDKTFDENARFLGLINSAEYHPLVLYPGEDALTAGTYPFQSVPGGKTVLIFLIDATWVLARKMMSRSFLLQRLPKLSFEKAYRSRFLIKTQPADYCLSTIESTYYLIKELQSCRVCDPGVSVEGMMKLFDDLNRFQMECMNTRFTANGPKKSSS